MDEVVDNQQVTVQSEWGQSFLERIKIQSGESPETSQLFTGVSSINDVITRLRQRANNYSVTSNIQKIGELLVDYFKKMYGEDAEEVVKKVVDLNLGLVRKGVPIIAGLDRGYLVAVYSI